MSSRALAPTRKRTWRAYRTTVWVLAQYTFYRILRPAIPEMLRAKWLQWLHVRSARRIESTMAALGGLYVKVGQLFSVLTNFLPEAFRKQLEGLQDAVPAHGVDEIRKRIREELGQDITEVFADFDERPLASASLGQVHAARLVDGTPVAVKVQYPGVEALVAEDLRALRKIARMVARHFNAPNVEAIYAEIETMVVEELDFEREALSLQQVRKNLASFKGVRVPAVYADYCTARMITMELMQGSKVTTLLESGPPGGDSLRRKVAHTLIDAYCRQIFEHGLYHADPHPGNLLVTSTGDVVLLDFGAVAELDEAMRGGLAELLQGLFTADSDQILRALRAMGFVDRRGSTERIERIVSVVQERLQSAIRLDTFALQDIRVDPQLVIDTVLDLRALDVGLRELAEVFHIPCQWIRLERSILMLTGVCSALDPELRPLDVIRPHVERLVLPSGQDWSTFALQTAKQVGIQLVGLPGELRKLISLTQRGRLEVRLPVLEAQVRSAIGFGHVLLFTACALTSGVLAVFCELQGRSDLAEPLAWAFAGATALALKSALSQNSRARRGNNN